MKKLFGTLGILVMALLGAYYYWNSDAEGVTVRTPLEIAGDDCTQIAAKAAMHLPEALPFQQLEKAARQSRVLEICMGDRGYSRNPDWDTYAIPLANQQAKQKGISKDEAYETLRREKLKIFHAISGEPLYWRLSSLK